MADQTSQVTGRPYSENQENGYIIREFSQDIPSFELVWHRDKEDRYVQAIHDTDWKFQLDNELPQTITKNKLGRGLSTLDVLNSQSVHEKGAR